MENGKVLRTGNLTIQAQMPDTIDGYQLFWGGEMRMTLDIYRDLASALLVALSFIYLLLIAYYRSFRIPLVAMAVIPLGLIGVFGGHWLMGQMFSGPSVIGIIALSGIVVRNSLLIIDFVLDYMKEGMPLYEAIKEAGAVRLRPILLTALTTAIGTAIMLSDPVFGGLAVSMIFGTISASILTMIVVPTLLYLLLRNKSIPGSNSAMPKPFSRHGKPLCLRISALKLPRKPWQQQRNNYWRPRQSGFQDFHLKRDTQHGTKNRN
jgi:multidrug efflux pump subunit AcrB